MDDTRRENRRAPAGFWVVWLTVAIDLVGFGIVLPLLPLFAKDFGARPLAATALVASYSAAQFATAPLWGRLSDRIGRKPVLVLALVGTAGGYVVTAAANSLWLLFVGRAIDGLSGSTYGVAQAAVIDVAPEHNRARLLGLLGAAFGLGFVAGPMIGGLAAFGGRRVPFIVAACLSGANAIAAMVRVPETAPRSRPRPEVDRSWMPHLDVFRRLHGASLAQLTVVAFLGTVGFSGFESTFALLLDHRFSARRSVVYALFTLIGIAVVIMQGRVVGVVAGRHKGEHLLRIAFAANLVGFVLLAVDGRWVSIGFALAFLVVGQGLFSPTLSSVTASAVDAGGRGEALGVQQSATALGRIAGPLVAGLLFEHVSVPAPYLLAAALALVAWFVVPSDVRPAIRRS